jgi:site-specific DNA-cytosine methylase
MKVLELFAGTRSISKAFEKRGHETYSIEWNKDFENIDLYADINNVTAKDIIKLCNGVPDVIWASPDCTTYSIAAISHHRKKNTETGNLDAVSDYAKFCDRTNKHVLDLIQELKPKYYFIENPRGRTKKNGLYERLV